MPFRFQRVLSRNPPRWRTTTTYKMGSKPQMMDKDKDILGTVVLRKRNMMRRILKSLALIQPLRMQSRNRHHLHHFPQLSSRLRLTRQSREASQRRTLDRPPMKDLPRHIRYPHHASTLRLQRRHYLGRLLPVTDPHDRQVLVCWRRSSVGQDHLFFPQRAEMKTRSIWQIG